MNDKPVRRRDTKELADLREELREARSATARAEATAARMRDDLDDVSEIVNAALGAVALNCPNVKARVGLLVQLFNEAS